jgi:apolipoprotein N-acyltransferase
LETTRNRLWFAGLAASGAALVLGFPPFSIPVLPFAALVPLFIFLEGRRSRPTVALGAAAFAVPFFVGALGWLFLLVRITPAGALGAVGLLAIQLATFALFPAALIVARRIGRVPLAVCAPAFWVVSEHARTYGDIDFAWTALGSALSGWPSLIQHADLIGVWGISFWIVLVSALAATALSTDRSARVRIAAAVVVALSIGGFTAYGRVRTRSLRAELAGAKRLRVAAVQPNIAQRLKWDPAAKDRNIAALNRVIAVAEHGSPELVVAPEACLPLIMRGDAERLPEAVSAGTCPLVLGVVRGIGDPKPVVEGGVKGYRYERHWNSAVLASPDRTMIDVHDKSVLVPITEQIPFRRVLGVILPFMSRQFGRFEAGGPQRPIVLDLPGRQVRLGLLICFETLHPEEVRAVVNRGADVLVAITNDAWFGRSNMPWQHLGLSVMRAIETRRSVVRSANTGVSALIDPLGEVVSRTELFEETVLAGEVPLCDVTSVYSRLGDLVLWLAYALSALIMGWVGIKALRP